MQTTILEIPGMRCGSCVTRAENALRAVPGVESVVVDLVTKKAMVQYHGTEEGKLVAAISRRTTLADGRREDARE